MVLFFCFGIFLKMFFTLPCQPSSPSLGVLYSPFGLFTITETITLPPGPTLTFPFSVFPCCMFVFPCFSSTHCLICLFLPPSLPPSSSPHPWLVSNWPVAGPSQGRSLAEPAPPCPPLSPQGPQGYPLLQLAGWVCGQEDGHVTLTTWRPSL